MEFGVRRSRVLGLIWILAGLALLAAAVLLWLDREQLSWFEAPLGLVGIAVGVHLWSQRVEVDRHGVAMVSRSGTERVLWASVAAVDVRDSWVRPALVIERKSDAARQVVQATSGLSRRQRNAMFDVLHQLGREHGFDVRRDGRPATPTAASSRADDAAGRRDAREPVFGRPTTSAEQGAAQAPADEGNDDPGAPDGDQPGAQDGDEPAAQDGDDQGDYGDEVPDRGAPDREEADDPAVSDGDEPTTQDGDGNGDEVPDRDAPDREEAVDPGKLPDEDASPGGEEASDDEVGSAEPLDDQPAAP